MVLQKAPKHAKGTWTRHDTPDAWEETVPTNAVQPESVVFQKALIEATTAPNDPSLDAAAGSFSVLAECGLAGRRFIGGDING